MNWGQLNAVSTTNTATDTDNMPKQPQPNDPNYLLPIGSNVTERLNQRIAVAAYK